MAYEDAVQALNPSSYWKLDEASGPTATDEEAVQNGTYDGAGITYSEAALVVNDAGSSIKLDYTVAGAITIGDIYDFTGSTQFTVIAWGKLETYNAVDGHFLFSNIDNSALRGWALTIGGDPPVLAAQRADASGVDQTSYNTTEVALEGITHMYGAVYDGTDLKVVFDGVFVQSQVSSRSVVAPATNTNLTIGKYGGGGSGWDGWFDEPAIWSGTALSEAQLTSLYQAGTRSARAYKRLYGPAQLTGSAADLYTCPASTVTRILGIHASNPSGSPVDINLSIGADATGTRIFDDYAVPADGIVRESYPYELAAGEKIQGWADSAGTVVLSITGYEDPA